MSIASPLRAIEQLLAAQTEAIAWQKKKFPIGGIHFPYDALNVENQKSEIFRFLNSINGAQTTCQPHCFLISCVQLVKYLHLQFKFLAQRGQTKF